MPSSDTTTELARRKINRIADEGAKFDLMTAHRDTTNCRDCEAFVRQDPDAFRFLSHLEEALREAHREGLLTEPSAQFEVVAQSARELLQPFQIADQWVKQLQGTGCDVEGYAQLKREEDTVRQRLEEFDLGPGIDRDSR